MNFKTSIIWSGKLYKILEKLNAENIFKLDTIIDNNYPQVLSKLQTYAKSEKIAILATNGKKTTTDFFNQILNASDKTFISNVSKSAKRYPIFTSIILDLAKGLDIFSSTCEKDHYTMAFDEFELSAYFNSMKFDYLLLHNLFADQRDFCSLEEKRKKIQDAIMLNSKLNLIINADEPMFFNIDDIKNDTILGKKRIKFYYGFEDIEFCDGINNLSHINDITKCPNCGCTLDYKKRFYSHLGQYDCECRFQRPQLDLSATAKIFSDYTFMTVKYKDNKFVFRIPIGGLSNAYNALGAIALAINLNIDRKSISTAFDEYEFLRARDEIVEFDKKQIKIKVIKNPIALSESIRELLGSKNTKVVFCLNDKEEDGLDPSWMWESNFKPLEGFENKIFICGNRFDDMALKLKYSGINPCLMVMDNNIQSSVSCCAYELEKRENMLVLATPSALKDVYSALKM